MSFAKNFRYLKLKCSVSSNDTTYRWGELINLTETKQTTIVDQYDVLARSKNNYLNRTQ